MSPKTDRDEFARIAHFFAPLASASEDALGLKDDAALFETGRVREMVVTTDALVARVHFLENDPPGLIAKKLLRVNLSDLAAMGALPRAYLMVLGLPKEVGDDWLEAFALGLREDQETFGVTLLGGDMVAIPGPLMLTLTLLGESGEEGVMTRSGARPGDNVFVSGTIGDAALGLNVLKGGLVGLDEVAADFLIARYRLPEPRLELGKRLCGLARAGTDISDGLAGDLGRICGVSSVGGRINASRVPLSAAARAALEREPSLMEVILGGGDDYELLFTAASEAESEITALGDAIGLQLTVVGTILEGEGVSIVDDSGAEIVLNNLGYKHF
ncbi:MAG: thiamine-phosphate kinase [Alphaproteobacteria bacterium]|jgi:thiamine-monophosphate kinase|nr:thiamine-phosphate kinase [Rhodospirillaceae bacterium]MDP7456912.1 thiamine-phosphate kinase [Alphaproteobacteria bacterium]HJO88452.1 thiamine-phosphate kinase [Alphaproteobacteria bacterium]|tara:strand:+ start:2960 stop:3949 length:990 start_codon:yes stop_codon:yes gene_type:complete